MTACLQLTVKESAAQISTRWLQSLVATESDLMVGWRPLEKSQQAHLIFSLLLSPQSGRGAQAPSPPECNFRTFTDTLYFVLPVPPSACFFLPGDGSRKPPTLLALLPSLNQTFCVGFLLSSKRKPVFLLQLSYNFSLLDTQSLFQQIFSRSLCVKPVLLGEDRHSNEQNKVKSLPP